MRFILLFILLLCSSVLSSQAQYPYLLPPDQFGKPVFHFPPGTQVFESNFNAIANYEPLYNFTAVNRYRRLGESVGRLDLELINRAGQLAATSNCTATLISEQYILTNYHCVPGTDPDLSISSVILRMGYLDEMYAPGEGFSVHILPVESNAALDYSVLRVQGNPASTFGYVPLYVRDPDPAEELFIIHHPKGDPQRLTRRNCRLVSSTYAVSANGLRHRCDTFAGSSGSLIFSDNNVENTFMIVGLHNAG